MTMKPHVQRCFQMCQGFEHEERAQVEEEGYEWLKDGTYLSGCLAVLQL